MRKADADNGYLLCFLLNLALNLEWGIISLVLLFCHYFFDFPEFLSLISLGIWLFEALFFTVLVAWGHHCSDGEYERRAREQVNKNPYSAKNSDLPHLRKIENRETDNMETKNKEERL